MIFQTAIQRGAATARFANLTLTVLADALIARVFVCEGESPSQPIADPLRQINAEAGAGEIRVQLRGGVKNPAFSRQIDIRSERWPPTCAEPECGANRSFSTYRAEFH